MRLPTLESARNRYRFGWEILDILVGGKSAIDASHGFRFSSAEEIREFVRSYGYDTEKSIESAELLGNFQESLRFVRKYFLRPENPNGLAIEMPKRILESSQVVDLFLMASFAFPHQGRDAAGQALAAWACALLKVMHTIAHMDKDIRSPYFGEIQKQILDRYYRMVHRDEKEALYLGCRKDDPLRVDLVTFESKPKKSRDSTLLKLLHKPENVAEELFDRVGIRVVTRTRLDAIRVVKFLVESRIIAAPNIKPSRSRNSLVDVGALMSAIHRLEERPNWYIAELDSLDAELEAACQAAPIPNDNPHSSSHYRSIQFTCRQLIKIVNPLHDEMRELKAAARSAGSDELLKRIEKIDLRYAQKEIRFFFPYEVQIMDEASARENERGRSAHSEYKKAQVLTAMRRVMGPLADAGR